MDLVAAGPRPCPVWKQDVVRGRRKGALPKFYKYRDVAHVSVRSLMLSMSLLVKRRRCRDSCFRILEKSVVHIAEERCSINEGRLSCRRVAPKYYSKICTTFSGPLPKIFHSIAMELPARIVVKRSEERRPTRRGRCPGFKGALLNM